LRPQAQPASLPHASANAATGFGRVGLARQTARTGVITLGMVAVGVYLWVIHSQKLPLSQAAIGVGLLALLIQREPVRVAPPLAWFGVFVAWSFMSAAASPYQDMALEGAWGYLKLWLIFLITANVAHTTRQLRAFMIIWLGLFALYPVRGTLFNLLSSTSTQDRYAWNFIFSNPNDLATLTLPMFAMSVALLPRERGWTRAAALAGSVLLPTIIVATQSRGGIVAFAVMSLLLFREGLVRKQTTPAAAPRRRRSKAATVAVSLLAVVAIVIVAPKGVWKRLEGLRSVTDTENLQAVDKEGSAEQRYEIWKVSWAISADHPLFGVGATVYPEVHKEYARSSRFKPTAAGLRDTHSTYFNMLAEGGIIGLFLLLGMLGSTLAGLRSAAASRTDDAHLLRILGIGLIGFLLASVFATMQHVSFLYLYIALITIATRIVTPQAASPVRLPLRPASRR